MVKSTLNLINILKDEGCITYELKIVSIKNHGKYEFYHIVYLPRVSSLSI